MDIFEGFINSMYNEAVVEFDGIDYIVLNFFRNIFLCVSAITEVPMNVVAIPYEKCDWIHLKNGESIKPGGIRDG